MLPFSHGSGVTTMGVLLKQAHIFFEKASQHSSIPSHTILCWVHTNVSHRTRTNCGSAAVLRSSAVWFHAADQLVLRFCRLCRFRATPWTRPLMDTLWGVTNCPVHSGTTPPPNRGCGCTKMSPKSSISGVPQLRIWKMGGILNFSF